MRTDHELIDSFSQLVIYTVFALAHEDQKIILDNI